jgi:GAF domain-containing protein
VFTPDRIAVLKVLASQAAIALENARLYRDLEQREAEIRSLKDQQARRLSQAMDDLEYRKMKGAA